MSAYQLALQLALPLARRFGSCAEDAETHHLVALLPGLQYFSLALDTPTTGSIVASSNCAVAGPLTLCLDDAKNSAAGLVIRLARPLQGALGGRGGPLLARLSDVARMAASQPECGYVMCMPVAADTDCVRGAVLLGFAAPPVLGVERHSALGALCSLLGGALEGGIADVLSLVNHLLDAPIMCACRGEEEEREAEASRARARNGVRGRGRNGGRVWAPPQRPLPSVPEGFESEEDEAVEPGASVAAGASGTPALTAAPTPARVSNHVEPARQHRFWLTYTSAHMEEQFLQWYRGQQVRNDALFFCALAGALAVLAAERHGRAAAPALALALKLLIVCAAVFISAGPTRLFERHRELAALGLRLAGTALFSLPMKPMLRVFLRLPPACPSALELCCWVLGGSHALVTSAQLGLQVRFWLQIPLQLMALAAAVIGEPGSVPTLALAGFVLPSLLLRWSEARARQAFEQKLSITAQPAPSMRNTTAPLPCS